MQNYNNKYDYYLNLINQAIDNYLDKIKTKEIVFDALKYSLLAGGKRVRPVLMLATADVLGVDLDKILPFSIATEMVHTYSLIHDDLPAMDNDDFRRGKPSCHKVFGEGQAILAGDALLNEAFNLCLNNINDGASLEATKILFSNAGLDGMIGGQSADLKFEKSTVFDKNDLDYIILNKTAKLIQAPIIIASVFANNKHFDLLSDYSINLGFLFQITDDILDVVGNKDLLGKSLGKDADEGKLTSVSLYGLDEAKALANKIYLKSLKCLERIDNCDFLIDFTKKIYTRTHWLMCSFV